MPSWQAVGRDMLAAAAMRLLQQWFIAIAAAATRRERQRVSRETEIKETSQIWYPTLLGFIEIIM